MFRTTALLALLAALSGSAMGQTGESMAPMRVLLTVGGVGYHTSIVRLLDANANIELIVRNVDDNSIVFDSDVLKDIDAILMYHRDNVAEPEERSALMAHLQRGRGIVVLHHAIANYVDWDAWWRDHLGGLYVLAGHDELEPSEYFYNFVGVARPTSDHSITKRLGAYWRYRDESYNSLWISEDIEPLLTTTAFGSENRLAWIGPSPSNRVVYIQPGHFEQVLTDPNYLMLIEDALRWTARGAK